MFWKCPPDLAAAPVFPAGWKKLRPVGVICLPLPTGFGFDQWELTRNLAGGRGRSCLFPWSLPGHPPFDFSKQKSGHIPPCSHSVAPSLSGWEPIPASDHEVPPWPLRVCSCQLPVLCTSKSLPGSWSRHSSLHLQHSSYLRGQPQRTSLSSPGCCAPALSVSAPIVVPAARLGSARSLKAGVLFPEPHQCSWNAEFIQMDRGSARLLASEALSSLSSVAAPGSGPSRLWKEGALLDSPMGGCTKRGQGGPRRTGGQDSGESPGKTGCLSRQGNEEGCVQTRSHVFKNNSAVSSGETI